MTEEQVTELERRAETAELRVLAKATFLRLLDERKRLLAELKVEVAEHGRSYSIAAIAYAEEAAP